MQQILPRDSHCLLGLDAAEQLLRLEELRPPVSVTEDAVVPDLDEAGGQDVEEEATDELGGIQGHHLGLVVAG